MKFCLLIKTKILTKIFSSSFHHVDVIFIPLTLYLIETPFNTFQTADPDQAALVRALVSLHEYS